MKKPKTWSEAYPYGTKEGADEQRFWTTITQDPERPYMSIALIAKRSGLSVTRIEEIIEKYATCDLPLLYASLEDEDSWGYWERCQNRLPPEKKSIAQKDQDDRIKKYFDS